MKRLPTAITWIAVLLMLGSLSSPVAQQGFSYAEYDALLKAYVNPDGMVDYRGLKADRARLDGFVKSLGAVDRGVYSGWSDNEKLAFLINAYNAITLRVIIDNYPIKSSIFKSIRFPKNSIRQISGAWDKKKFNVMGERMTLNHIEHDIIRAKFSEPRIHMALVCAAMGCPPLRNEAFDGASFDGQLDDQTRRMLSHPLKFRIDTGKGTVYLSSIFKWFGDDFVTVYPHQGKFSHLEDSERSVLTFIHGYLNDSDRAFISGKKFDIDYFDYDWSLNEQK